MKEYHKIPNIFLRSLETKRIAEGEYANEELNFLRNIEWLFTEKVDGTNTRIVWDGHKVKIYGRTDDASIPAELVNRLVEKFCGEANEQIFEQNFGEKKVVLIGEGYGAKIQGCGGKYRADQDFILFDVMIGENFQSRDAVENIATYFNLEVVPIVFAGTLEEGVEFVKSQPKSRVAKEELVMEGVVGRPAVELQDRCGNRIIVKIKTHDFKEW